jgi:putative membrane protein
MEIEMHRTFFARLIIGIGCVVGLGFTAAPRIARTALTDAEVLGIYIQVNGFDIESALLAKAQAVSPTVRALASEVAKDHLGVRQAAYELAATCKVIPNVPNARNSAAVEHSKSLTTLAAISGAEFDRAYIQREVVFHRSAINAVQDALLPAATCPALKAHFTQILPALEQHAKETERIANSLPTR